MKDQVVMSKNNGQLAVAIPLFRIGEDSMFLEKFEGYSLIVSNDKAVAYAVDCGDEGIHLLNAEFVEKNLEFLGEL